MELDLVWDLLDMVFKIVVEVELFEERQIKIFNLNYYFFNFLFKSLDGLQLFEIDNNSFQIE